MTSTRTDTTVTKHDDARAALRQSLHDNPATCPRAGRERDLPRPGGGPAGPRYRRGIEDGPHAAALRGAPDHPPGYLFEVIRESNVDDGLAPEALLCVEDFMTQGPVTVPPETPARAVARRMFEGRIHLVIVIGQDKRPIGIVTSLNLRGVS